MTIPNVGEIWKYKHPRHDGTHDFIMITCINAGENTTLGVSVAEPSDHRKLSFENVTKYWIKVS